MRHIQLGAWSFLCLFLGFPVYAQNQCTDCIHAARVELTKCLENAISQEDKKSCGEKQEGRSKSCRTGECKIEQQVLSKEPVIPKAQVILNEPAVQHEVAPEKK